MTTKLTIGLTIETVTKDMIAQAATLRHKLWPQDSCEAHQNELSALYDEMAYCAFIARIGDQNVGFAEVSLRPYVNGCLYRPCGFLEGIWVEPAFQRQQIGAQLVQKCEIWARAQGAKELGSDAYLENTASHDAHQSWGFTQTEKVVYFRKKL